MHIDPCVCMWATPTHVGLSKPLLFARKQLVLEVRSAISDGCENSHNKIRLIPSDFRSPLLGIDDALPQWLPPLSPPSQPSQALPAHRPVVAATTHSRSKAAVMLSSCCGVTESIRSTEFSDMCAPVHMLDAAPRIQTVRRRYRRAPWQTIEDLAP